MNTKNHIPHRQERKPNRKQNFNYAIVGYYFITTCIKAESPLLSEIKNDQIRLNQFGEIIENRWKNISQNQINWKSIEHVIMPNHFHALIQIKKADQISIPEIVKQLKGFAARKINQKFSANFYWQRSFHDHIIQNEKEFFMIKNYIKNNPKNWKEDRYFRD